MVIIILFRLLHQQECGVEFQELEGNFSEYDQPIPHPQGLPLKFQDEDHQWALQMIYISIRSRKSQYKISTKQMNCDCCSGPRTN